MRPARTLAARYAGTCADCGAAIEVGETIHYRRPDAVHERCTLPAAPSSTHRERLEAKADRREEWAEARAGRAETTQARADQMAEAIPFGQPILVGHYSEGRDRRYRGRMVANMDRAHDHRKAAANHEQKAAGLRSQLAGAIYDDDPDALDRLREKLTKLEAQRANAKAKNAAYRKEHAAELKTMTAYQRGQAVPFPSYYGQNLTGNIGRIRDRITRLERQTNQ